VEQDLNDTICGGNRGFRCKIDYLERIRWKKIGRAERKEGEEKEENYSTEARSTEQENSLQRRGLGAKI